MLRQVPLFRGKKPGFDVGKGRWLKVGGLLKGRLGLAERETACSGACCEREEKLSPAEPETVDEDGNDGIAASDPNVKGPSYEKGKGKISRLDNTAPEAVATGAGEKGPPDFRKKMSRHGRRPRQCLCKRLSGRFGEKKGARGFSSKGKRPGGYADPRKKRGGGHPESHRGSRDLLRAESHYACQKGKVEPVDWGGAGSNEALRRKDLEHTPLMKKCQVTGHRGRACSIPRCFLQEKKGASRLLGNKGRTTCVIAQRRSMSGSLRAREGKNHLSRKGGEGYCQPVSQEGKPGAYCYSRCSDEPNSRLARHAGKDNKIASRVAKRRRSSTPYQAVGGKEELVT